jgi:hypothetical protein
MAEITNAMIDAQIAVFTTDRNKLRDLGQTVAMMILNHAAPEDAGPNAQGTGDCTRAVKLANEMPNSWAGQLSSWFNAFSPIRIVGTKAAYDDEYKKLKITPKMTAEEKQAVRDERLAWWNLEEAAIQAFHTFEEPKAVAKVLDIAGLLKWMEAQAKSIEKKAEGDKVKEEAIASALDIAKYLRAYKFVPVAPANEEENLQLKAVG